MLTYLHNKLFGSWKKKSVAQVKELSCPGVYFMTAKAHGLKSWFSGYHSWIVHYDPTAVNHYMVYEINDLVALEIQGATVVNRYAFGSPTDQILVSSNRHGCQLWFGANFKELAFIPDVPRRAIHALCEVYPYKNNFKLLSFNCNTFSSWMAFVLAHYLEYQEVKLPFTWGSRPLWWWKRYSA